MIFEGIGRTFSTVHEQQYRTIGAFWDELTAVYGLENLQGLGCGWTENTIEYVIGLKDGIIPGADRRVTLPDEGWTRVLGRTDALPRIYDEIYRDGPLKYEIERFTESGGCEILYVRAG